MRSAVLLTLLCCSCAIASCQRARPTTGSTVRRTSSSRCGVVYNSSRPHPWIARLGYWTFDANNASGRPAYSLKWLCGGSLISSTVIVTAAHCVDGALRQRRQLLARLGEMDTTRSTGCEQNVYVSRIVLHPEYDRSTQSHHHDIAVLRLRSPAQLSACVNTICLPLASLQPAPGTTVRLAGWGLVAFTSDEVATRLKTPTRRLLPLQDCTESYPPFLLNAFYPGGLGDNKICVASGQNVPICKGDSGGPVVWYSLAWRRYILLGVISVGIGCGADHPGINTRVASYVQWILANR